MTYVEAILRVYNRYGRRDNLYKARIKILVKALGIEEFARQVEEEWALTRDGPGHAHAAGTRPRDRALLHRRPTTTAARTMTWSRQHQPKAGFRALGRAQRAGASAYRATARWCCR